MGIWRPPKRTNKRAWREIDAGNIWWDTKAIERTATRRNQRNMLYFAHLHAIKHWKRDCALGIVGACIPDLVMYERLYGFKLPNKGYNR